MLMTPHHQSGFGLYIHWPYCARLCPYCDFNIYKNKPEQEAALVVAIIKDIKYWGRRTKGRTLSSIHFGGGTPSLLSADHMTQIIQTAKNAWDSSAQIEIGLEANPNTITQTSLQNWRAAGVERLSIGVQSFNDDALTLLGRDHNGAQAKAALIMAADIMPRVSCDLIYGWRNGDYGQSVAMWTQDLSQALETGIGHISAYQLTIEQATAFGRAALRGIDKAVGADSSADLYEAGRDLLGAKGFVQYEVSNFAKDGQIDQRSRHNLIYWRGGEYVGVGPGAHGRVWEGDIPLRRVATICANTPQDYREAVGKTETGTITREIMSNEAYAEEYVLMGLRIDEGIDLARFSQIGGTFNQDLLEDYQQAGLISLRDNRLIATSQGRMVLDHICQNLLLETEAS